METVRIKYGVANVMGGRIYALGCLHQKQTMCESLALTTLVGVPLLSHITVRSFKSQLCS